MDPHAELVSRLFTAASRAGRFAKFRSYYFHNCVYNSVYEDAQFRKAVPVADLLATQRSRREARDGRRRADAPGRAARPGRLDVPLLADARAGIEWLRRLAQHFRSAAWLNPEPERFWSGTTIEVIARCSRCFRSRSTASRRPCATSCAVARSRASVIRRSGSSKWGSATTLCRVATGRAERGRAAAGPVEGVLLDWLAAREG